MFFKKSFYTFFDKTIDFFFRIRYYVYVTSLLYLIKAVNRPQAAVIYRADDAYERNYIMKFTKILAVIMVMFMLCLSMVACAGKNADDGKDSNDTSDAAKTESDMQYVVDKGTLVVGITDFAPMDYKDENNEWVGFDADMAKAFAESLGVNVEFIEIEWGNKIFELDGKSIDCAWNGMTLTDDVLAAMECSNAYCNNQQIVIVPADKAEQYQTVESVAKLNFAVEAGSAGEEQVNALGYSCTPVLDQATALNEVKAGTCDAAVIDSLMAAAMVGEGTGYADLTYTVGLNDEEYGVGFRKGSDLAAKLNEFFKSSYADGTMVELAERYGVEASLIKQ